MLDLRWHEAYIDLLSSGRRPHRHASGHPRRKIVRKILCSLLLLSALVSLSLAQSLRTAGPNPAPLAPTVPPYCHPCLFYGGDFDPAGSNPNGLDSDQVLSTGGSYTLYIPFVVPAGQQWTVGGLFVNVLSTANVVDPAKATYSISTGVSRGNAGTTIATATGPTTYAPTGRSWNGYTEYTLTVTTHPTILQPGTYWLSVVARCTNPPDQVCHTARYYVSDVEDDPPSNRVGFEPGNDSFLSSTVLNDYYSQTWGTNGVCSGFGCNRFSAGVIGKAQKSSE